MGSSEACERSFQRWAIFSSGRSVLRTAAPMTRAAATTSSTPGASDQSRSRWARWRLSRVSAASTWMPLFGPMSGTLAMRTGWPANTPS